MAATDRRPRCYRIPAQPVWIGLEGDRVLICTRERSWNAKDMHRDPRVAHPVTDTNDPYRIAALQGRVVEVRPDAGCEYMNPISVKYAGHPFPIRTVLEACGALAPKLRCLHRGARI